MNKPQLSLALSLSLVLLQANTLTAKSEPQGAIWQQMSGSGVAKASQRAVAAKSAVKSTKAVTANTKELDPHAMLFLSGKSKEVGAGGAAPAAALTIHPALPLEEIAAAPVGAATMGGDIKPGEAQVYPEVAQTEAPVVAPKIAALPSSALTSASSKQLVAQLAPDHIMAQADHSTLTPQPIPPVVTGTLDFEEYKVTNIIDLKTQQSRTFKLKNKIVRTSISDPGIAEPVVVSENQLVLLGKSAGTCTMVLWDDAGNSVALDLRVSRDYSQLQATLREIDPRIIVKAFSVAGSDRVLLTGDVDHPESIIKAFAASNVFMDDRGMNIQVANSRILAGRIGEQGGTSATSSSVGQLATIGSVDRYTYFSNLANNIGKSQVMVSDGGRVTSLVKVRKVPLIVLHVTFLEMNTTSARELAMNLGFGVANKSFSFGVGGSTSAAVAANQGVPYISNPGLRQFQTALGLGAGPYQNPLGGVDVPVTTPQALTFDPRGPVVQPVNFIGGAGIGQNIVYGPTALLTQANLLGSPGGVNFAPGLSGNMFTGQSNWGGRTAFSLNPTVQGIIGQRRARVLAEPTLVTISGERASFLAGGEIPILQAVAAAGAAQQSVVFEPFGMRINMIPVLQDNGTINLEISPEERLLANNLALSTIAGGNGVVPGFTTRKTQTIVELKPGQELYIAGLVSTNVGREITKMPVLGEVPVLGALYRSKAFNKNESELVIAVRPEIILPGTPGQLKLPEEIGRVEGPRDLNMFQVEPSVIDERYYTSGRAERHQKTSPTLPEGAPVPDNE